VKTSAFCKEDQVIKRVAMCPMKIGVHFQVFPEPFGNYLGILVTCTTQGADIIYGNGVLYPLHAEAKLPWATPPELC
jgi:hypothetical protein